MPVGEAGADRAVAHAIINVAGRGPRHPSFLHPAICHSHTSPSVIPAPLIPAPHHLSFPHALSGNLDAHPDSRLKRSGMTGRNFVIAAPHHPSFQHASSGSAAIRSAEECRAFRLFASPVSKIIEAPSPQVDMLYPENRSRTHNHDIGAARLLLMTRQFCKIPQRT